MPRGRRLFFPGWPHHIVQRGHNRERCFFSAADCELYLGLLTEYSKAHACEVHAFALMPNHVHLLVTPHDARAASQMLRHVSQRFVQSINRHHGRCGSIWQGRFKASVVDTNSYFLACQRYIELNPVRAALAGTAADSEWTSHGFYARGSPSLLLVPHPVYLALGRDEAARRLAYRSLFEAELPQEAIDRIREAARGNRPLGDDAFIERLKQEFGPVVARQRPGRKPKDRPPSASGELFP